MKLCELRDRLIDLLGLHSTTVSRFICKLQTGECLPENPDDDVRIDQLAVAIVAMMAARAPTETRDALQAYAALPATSFRGEWPEDLKFEEFPIEAVDIPAGTEAAMAYMFRSPIHALAAFMDQFATAPPAAEIVVPTLIAIKRDCGQPHAIITLAASATMPQRSLIFERSGTGTGGDANPSPGQWFFIQGWQLLKLVRPALLIAVAEGAV
jgi:hypothetical protein